MNVRYELWIVKIHKINTSPLMLTLPIFTSQMIVQHFFKSDALVYTFLKEQGYHPD